MCEAMRKPPAGFEAEGLPRLPCRPVDTVYCQQINGALICADDEAMCNLSADMNSEVMRNGEAHAKCVARYSVRDADH